MPLKTKTPKAESRRILVADDEPDVRQLVTSKLKAAGFSVISAEDGPSTLSTARAELPSLIILDLMLPGMSGLEICKSLKSHSPTSSIPIIMLTAKAEEVDRIVGFELGADDYITKPFSPRELVLRVQSVLRRSGGQESESDVLKAGGVSVDRIRHTVQLKGSPLKLTATEFKLLCVLIERRGRVLSRDTLLQDVWAYESMIDTRTVDTHIRRLREKLEDAGGIIETVRGFGYRIPV